MRGPRPASCTFPEEFLQEARNTVRRRTASVRSVQRFRLALLLRDEPWLCTEAAAQRVGLSARQVQRWRQRWTRGDFSVDDRAGRGRKPAFSPDG
jgi:transposase